MASAPGKTILLVEDEPTLQRILGSVLSDASHVVATVGTAEAALERARAGEDIDLVLSDKNLPGMSGLDLLEHVRAEERRRGQPIGFVLVTGYPSRESALSVLVSGGDGYLVKPFRSLSHAVGEVDALLATDLAPRRAAARTARAVAEALAGVHAGTLTGARVAILVDDPALALRVSTALSAAGAQVADDGAAVACSDRVDRLLAWQPDRGDVSRVLCDVTAPLDDLVALIRQGGGTALDPALVTGR